MIGRGRIFIKLLIALFVIHFAASHTSAASKEETSYQSARDAYYDLKGSAKKRKFRHNWIKVIKKYERVYKKYPKGPRSDESLYMAAKLYMELSPFSGKDEDLGKSNKYLETLVNKYPKSPLADDAAFMMGENYEKLGDEEKAYNAYIMVLEKFSKGDMAGKARKRTSSLKASISKSSLVKPSPAKSVPVKSKPVERRETERGKTKSSQGKRSGNVHVTDVRHWSNPNYTRIVIYLDGPAKYKHHLLRQDPGLGKPPRLYIDIFGSRKIGSLDEEIPINDGLLKRARAAQHDHKTVRVVLDIESIKDYKVFPMPDPFKIVIDVWGEDRIKAPKIEAFLPGGKRDKMGLQATIKDETMSLSKQLGLGIRKIVLDPGHGGKDPGAVGPRGTKEKDVNLRIAKSLKKKLEQNFSYQVVLTRSDDRYLGLAERTAIANMENADLFISIHVNANRNKRAYGMETYVMNARASDRYAAEVAARENAVTSNSMGEFGSVLEEILVDMQRTNKVNESSKLASSVQRGMVNYIAKRYDRVKNLGVKKAPFYVLIGANMPSILVEVGFISNKTEEKRLRTDKYVENLSSAMALGIDRYAKLIKGVARAGRQPGSEEAI